MPLVVSPWILTTFDKQQVTEGTQTSTVVSCFDADGFLTGRRTFASFGSNPARQAHDLLAIFVPIPKDNVGAGGIGTEQYLGGDDPDPANSSDGYAGAPLTADCLSSSNTDNYRI